MFGRKKSRKPERREYDASLFRPVLKCSICNGEQVAGFLNLKTGKFEEVQLIRSERELQEFLESCGLTEIEKIY